MCKTLRQLLTHNTEKKGFAVFNMIRSFQQIHSTNVYGLGIVLGSGKAAVKWFARSLPSWN